MCVVVLLFVVLSIKFLVKMNFLFDVMCMMYFLRTCRVSVRRITSAYVSIVVGMSIVVFGGVIVIVL